MRSCCSPRKACPGPSPRIISRQAGRSRDLRQELAFGRLHGEACGIHQMLLGQNRRVVGVCEGIGLLEAPRQHLRHGRSRLQLARILADDLAVGRGARLGLRARLAQPRNGGGPARVGLRNVRARALAHFEARARGARLLFQELQVRSVSTAICRSRMTSM